MLYMSSQMGNDGSYTLAVTFDIGTDLNTALVMVQNRVQLAMPLLPTSVQNQGITIRKKTPDILMVISLLGGSPVTRLRLLVDFSPVIITGHVGSHPHPLRDRARRLVRRGAAIAAGLRRVAQAGGPANRPGGAGPNASGDGPSA